ncbi:hypothetical protein [Tessaracoccus sp. OH4464_COT-324]|uniref:hypothetical protein n=1 Tax=Tessaracoccus sp. OH4464_COT-324 TaxID=2491059 RepID=UPI000F633B1E|nr:hypothetical protein [Tessaracoccus sp. OH4464_COT-324]RRD46614.1 hypothetical protein EII42_06250 [Tessaracoccus sp. OH4464_COT-324]
MLVSGLAACTDGVQTADWADLGEADACVTRRVPASGSLLGAPESTLGCTINGEVASRGRRWQSCWRAVALRG